jgi:metallo-beta-lactamase class B
MTKVILVAVLAVAMVSYVMAAVGEEQKDTKQVAAEGPVYVLDAKRDARFCSWNRPVTPFRIIGNIYYVGAGDISSFLITTPAGHILLETGFAETAPLIRESVTKLGFKLEDIKILLVTHEHFDHAGGLAELKSLTGARLIASEAEAASLASGGRGDFQFGDKLAFRSVKADQIVRDKDTISLGGVVMTARLTPGHTKGCTTWTMKVTEGDKSYEVVFMGSVSIPGYKLTDNVNYPDIASDYAHSFEVLKELPCEVFLGMHGFDFALKEKMLRLEKGEEPNPFIDSQGYRQAIEKAERNYKNQLAKETGNRETEETGRGN